MVVQQHIPIMVVHQQQQPAHDQLQHHQKWHQSDDNGSARLFILADY